MENTIDTAQLWNDTLESIKVSVSPAIFSTWFSQTHLATVKNTQNHLVAEIGCKSGFVKTTVESRYYGLIQDSLEKSLNKQCDLVFIIKDTPAKNVADLTISASPLFNQTKTLSPNEDAAKSRIRPFLTFNNYAVSSSNQMAWAAAEAVSKNLGTAYNPLFIWGGVGVGKTHLMNAVGHKILSELPESNVYFCSGEEFTNDIVEGIRNKSTQRFRDKYRKLNLLLLDDIQFIAGKEAVQEEFFHTFNALVSFGSQIILTSDRPPSDIPKLEERLRSRFEAGLIVDVSPPDFELRCAIVQIKAKEKNIEIDMEAVQLIAGNTDSPRKIEGFLTKLISASLTKKEAITTPFIQSLIGAKNEDETIKTSPNDLIAAVSKYYSIGKRVLLGTSRSRPIALPRQILMYLLRTQLALPLEEVGNIVGRDHTTVIHAVDKVTLLSSNSVQIREDIQGIKKVL